MKKSLFIALFAVMMMVAAPAMAGWYVQVDGHAAGYAADPDSSYAVSNWGWGNDNASANANGGGGFVVDTFAQGLGYAVQDIDAYAKGISDTCTYAFDFGTTSMAGAVAKTKGFADAGGEAYGFLGSKVEGFVFFEGTLSQSNNANEVNYPGNQFVAAGNESFMSYYAEDGFKDYGGLFWSAKDGAKICGEAITKGNSFVSIDYTGDHRSVVANTETSSHFDTSERGDAAYMRGSGGVMGQVTNQYGAVAGGAANFNYTAKATDSARGAANLNAQINKTSGSTTVKVSASSYASTY